MVINTNISAQSTATLLAQSSSMLSQSLARLSSGSKITSPADDSAGLAVSMNLVAHGKARITAASNNIANAISFNQTQDRIPLAGDQCVGSYEANSAVQAQDVTKSDSDRFLYQKEFSTLATYVNNVSTNEFNGVSLFNGTNLNVTTDSNGNHFTMTGVDLTGTTFTSLNSDSVGTVCGAVTALSDVQAAISQIATDRATLGANEETLNDYSGQLATLNNNLSAANSV